MSNNLFRLPLVATAALLLASSTSFAASGAGPEPYSAPTPSYKPMTSEPLIKAPPVDKASLGNDEDVKGPAAGPEPYSAPDPVYTPMKSEPTIHPTKTPAPKL